MHLASPSQADLKRHFMKSKNYLLKFGPYQLNDVFLALTTLSTFCVGTVN